MLVTGGGGFVGSFAVPALLEAGHDVRLLVRSPERALGVLARRGVGEADVELVVGDMVDADVVGPAAVGCDATIHAAAAIGMTGHDGTSVLDVNTRGARTVVDAALAAGHDPVVHVSSVAVFVPPVEPVIGPGSTLASPRTDYGRSKVVTEQELRARQDAGDPITIVYPGGVIGRDQPHLDATLEGLVAARTQGWPRTRGGVALVDVRDLADALVACLAPGAGPRRLVLGGHFLRWAELGALVDDITGVRAWRAPLPKPVLMAVATLLDGVRRVRPLSYPLTRDAAEIMTTMVATDDRATLDALGIELRPVRESLDETLRWLAEAGHLPARSAGRLAP
ncbi:NAD-dependent epimerase/dehydratase family protein [Iamia sp. SCSIO 61187]|uniref:NAD-dependent epimerase/dehydratase family protein n=1 Tax=Iamia sp. SCSIO 61187 TaxID=2722752 RepID=UPI001C627B0E|nr:NAD-dependent epimerase/dehydratase family protein [Iamia sp. SCSIO 61187]